MPVKCQQPSIQWIVCANLAGMELEHNPQPSAVVKTHRHLGGDAQCCWSGRQDEKGSRTRSPQRYRTNTQATQSNYCCNVYLADCMSAGWHPTTPTPTKHTLPKFCPTPPAQREGDPFRRTRPFIAVSPLDLPILNPTTAGH